MSGEFRELNRGFMWEALREAAEGEVGRHEISQALAKLYAALAPVEEGCAWYEAGDSGPSAPVMALVESWASIEATTRHLGMLYANYQDVIRAAVDKAHQGKSP